MEYEALFRGKRLDNGKWIEGYYATSGGTFIICDNCLTYGGFEVFEVDPATVGQYTGLTDKNGKKIFDGDILKLTCGHLGDGPAYTWWAIVEFGNPNGLYSWGWQLKQIGGYDAYNRDILCWIGMEETGAWCEIVSTIHDNP